MQCEYSVFCLLTLSVSNSNYSLMLLLVHPFLSPTARLEYTFLGILMHIWQRRSYNVLRFMNDPQKHLKLFVLLFAALICTSKSFGCIDELGNDVDWYVALRVPNSRRYIIYTS